MGGSRRFLAQVLLVGFTVTVAVVAGRAVFGPSAGRLSPVSASPLRVSARPAGSNGAAVPAAPRPTAPPSSVVPGPPAAVPAPPLAVPAPPLAVPAPPGVIPAPPLALRAPPGGIPRLSARRAGGTGDSAPVPAALVPPADLRVSRRSPPAEPAAGSPAEPETPDRSAASGHRRGGHDEARRHR